MYRRKQKRNSSTMNGYIEVKFSETGSTVEPAYNSVSLCDISSVASDILWY
jgi:hypothetical protein